jgi:PKD repeat protein
VRRFGFLALALTLSALAFPSSAAAVPTVVYTCTPAPADCSGWYTVDVTLRWFTSDDVLFEDGCNTWTFSQEGVYRRTCTASNHTDSVSRTVTIRIDKSPPQVTGATPIRPPDVNGWFNHGVSVTFAGADATSGIAACTTTSYEGPDTSAATLTGTCRDNAGLVSNPGAFALKFDATPPQLTALRATGRKGRVRVRWRPPADAATVQVVRTPGVGSEAQSVVFRGPGAEFLDRQVRDGVRYSYTVSIADAAGNADVQTVAAVPRRAWPSPAAGAALSGPPSLRWRPVRRAGYYNVQLFRGGRKIMSAWPSRAIYRLKRHWKYRGHRYGLSPGRYRWYVWPGYGRRSQHRFGRLILRRTFRIVD